MIDIANLPALDFEAGATGSMKGVPVVSPLDIDIGIGIVLAILG